jgi:hypothetical protein
MVVVYMTRKYATTNVFLSKQVILLLDLGFLGLGRENAGGTLPFK